MPLAKVRGSKFKLGPGVSVFRLTRVFGMRGLGENHQDRVEDLTYGVKIWVVHEQTLSLANFSHVIVAHGNLDIDAIASEAHFPKMAVVREPQQLINSSVTHPIHTIQTDLSYCN